MTKKLLIMVGVISLILAWCGKTIPETTTTNSKPSTMTYENKQYPLKLNFPSNRTFKENVYGTTVMFFVPKKGETTENLWIIARHIESWLNLETLYSDNKNILKEISSGFVIEEEKDIKIDNYPAKQIQYAFSQENYKIRQELIVIIKDETLYMISYTATQDTFDDYKKEIDKIIDSLKL